MMNLRTCISALRCMESLDECLASKEATEVLGDTEFKDRLSQVVEEFVGDKRGKTLSYRNVHEVAEALIIESIRKSKARTRGEVIRLIHGSKLQEQLEKSFDDGALSRDEPIEKDARRYTRLRAELKSVAENGNGKIDPRVGRLRELEGAYRLFRTKQGTVDNVVKCGSGMAVEVRPLRKGGPRPDVNDVNVMG